MIQGMGGYRRTASRWRGAAQRAIELETDPRSPWFAFANLILGHERYVAGDLEAGMNALPKAAYNDSAFAITRQFALATMSMIARERGEESLESPLRDRGDGRGGGCLPAGRAPGFDGLDGVGREPGGRRGPGRRDGNAR